MSESAQISILTFNTLGTPFIRGHQKKNYLMQTYFLPRRFKMLGKKLNESQADILCLQEVHLYPLLYILRRRLTNYPYVYFKPHVYGPRGGMVIFSRLALSHRGYIDFYKHGSFRNLTFIYNITQNGILYVKLADLPIYILNTTVSADTDHDWSEQSKFNRLKSAQLSQIGYTVRTLAAQGAAVVAVGDFNMPQGSLQYQEFCQKTEMEDLFTNYEIPTQHADFLPKDLEKIPRLDYIFATQAGLHVKETKHLFREKVALGKRAVYLSDHIALYSKLEYTFATKDQHAADVQTVINT